MKQMAKKVWKALDCLVMGGHIEDMGKRIEVHFFHAVGLFVCAYLARFSLKYIVTDFPLFFFGLSGMMKFYTVGQAFIRVFSDELTFKRLCSLVLLFCIALINWIRVLYLIPLIAIAVMDIHIYLKTPRPIKKVPAPQQHYFQPVADIRANHVDPKLVPPVVVRPKYEDDSFWLSEEDREALLGEYQARGILSPFPCNGMHSLDIPKSCNVILILASNDGYLYKTKLLYALWIADTLAIEETGHSITGLVYEKTEHGVFPIGLDILLRSPAFLVDDSHDFGDHIGNLIQPMMPPEYGRFAPEERECIKRASQELMGKGANEAKEIMRTVYRLGDVPLGLVERDSIVGGIL